MTHCIESSTYNPLPLFSMTVFNIRENNSIFVLKTFAADSNVTLCFFQLAIAFSSSQTKSIFAKGKHTVLIIHHL